VLINARDVNAVVASNALSKQKECINRFIKG
jgi:hypothetical protein